jgi:hypothetical protein
MYIWLYIVFLVVFIEGIYLSLLCCCHRNKAEMDNHQKTTSGKAKRKSPRNMRRLSQLWLFINSSFSASSARSVGALPKIKVLLLLVFTGPS